MNPEKSVNFSIIKQKIIKTDEVLRMYLETNNKLKNVQHTCKDIKLKYDQALLNLNRIQLENERCIFNSENMKLKCDLLEKENKELQEQKMTLEDKYNQQTVQSQLNIKELEDQLRMLQEIKSTAESITPKKKRNSSTMDENDKKFKDLQEKIKQLEDAETSNKTEIVSLNAQNKKLSDDIVVIEEKYSGTVNKLQIENSSLLEELNELKCQINEFNSNLAMKSDHDEVLINLNKKKDQEISDLQKKIINLVVDNNRLKIIKEENDTLKQQLMKQKTVLNEKTSTKDICLQTDLLTEKHTRTIHIQTSMSMKTFQQQDLVNTENRKLKQTILNCEAEIFKLKARPEISKKHCHTQTEEFENEVESVEDIFKEMCMPFPMLSPMSTSRENLSLDDMFSPIPADVNDILPVLANVPDIIITPPTPSIEKNIEKFTDFLKTTDIQNNHLIDDKNVSQRKQINITAKDNFKNSSEKIRRKSENTGAVVRNLKKRQEGNIHHHLLVVILSNYEKAV